MNLLWDNGCAAVYQGDSRSLPLEARSVNLCVTSPPYWGLRKYSGEQELVWGDEDHEHEWLIQERVGMSGGPSEKQVSNAGSWHQPSMNSSCPCGAWRGSYGLEPTVEMYIEHSMVFLDEVWRVLRDDGVVFWNLGDSYSGSGKGQGGSNWETSSKQVTNVGSYFGVERTYSSVPSKSLCLIPERFILAASERGWIVRSRIAWTKPNPMPESVRDRPTDAWESIFMLTKGPKYWWDQEAVREKATDLEYISVGKVRPTADNRVGFEIRGGLHNQNGARPYRNLRNVWEFPTEPYPEAHFAVFPTEIPRKCILAACPVDGLVLDPFGGAGTTAMVAQELGRRSVHVDLSEEYCQLAIKRLEAVALPMRLT